MAHVHSYTCGCPWVSRLLENQKASQRAFAEATKRKPSSVVPKVTEPTSPSSVTTTTPTDSTAKDAEANSTGPHIHGPDCGCSWFQTFKKNHDKAGVQRVLLSTDDWGDLESSADAQYDWTLPELPKCRPQHRILKPAKPAIKNAPPIVFWDDLDFDEGDLDFAFSDGEVEEAPEAKPPRPASPGKDKAAKSVRFNVARPATCLQTGQDIQPTPRTPQARRRWSRQHFKLFYKKVHDAMSSSSEDKKSDNSPSGESEEKEGEDEPNRPLKFIAEDLAVRQQLERAIDVTEANERASILRGALDFYMYVCHMDSHSVDKAHQVVRRLGKFSSVGSYVGAEREFAVAGKGQNTSVIPETMYRDKETAMSWLKGGGLRGPYNVTRIGSAKDRDLPW
ncbi:hypothetical protein ACJ41O_012057 [Fusarium nematophilum]